MELYMEDARHINMNAKTYQTINFDFMISVEDILQRNDLKNTACRKYIVGELLQSRTQCRNRS